MIGTRIGQYRVLQLLGEGGMGRVLLVEHVLMQTRHALKVLHDQLSKNEMIVQRFVNEARAAGAIGHRNVVEITHVDQMEGGGPWYLVMKYLEGHTLTGFLAAQGARTEQRLIVHIVGEALNGLQAAHDRRIIHRDLKPDNLYITSVKDDPYRTIILDFGVAQLGHEAGVVTRTGTMIGTPQYMAPEQHRSIPIDHRADIWAMGAIVYEIATGRLPYQVDGAERGFLTGPEIFHRMMTRPVVDPRQYNPAITEAFAKATLMALAIDPARRPERARAFARMLAEGTPGNSHAPSGIEVLRTHADELLDGEAAGEPAAPPALAGSGRQRRVAAQIAVPSAPMSTLGATASQSFPAAQRRRASPARRAWLAVGAGVVAATVAGIVLVSRHDAPSATTSHDQVSAPHVDAPIATGPAPDDAEASAVTKRAAATPEETVSSVEAADAGPVDAALLAVSPRDARVPSAPIPAARVEPAAAGTIDAARLAVYPRDAGVPDAPVQAARTEPTAARKKDAAEVTPRDTNLPDAPIKAARTEPTASGKKATAVTAPRDTRLPDAPVKAARADLAATGKLKVVILPWAEVWVDGRPLGQTPVLTKVSVGPHRVRLKNDVNEKTVNVTVTTAKTTVIDETW